MSIRLRLTLLYSAILALTLIVFSSTLYLIQSQVTYDEIKNTLARQAEGFAGPGRRPPLLPGGPSGPTPLLPGGTSGLTPLPGRWAQLRSPDGTVIGQSADLSDTTLPLSDAGLAAVQNGSPWIETAQVQDEPLLVYSLPVRSQSRVSQIVQVAGPTTEREQSLNTLRLILFSGSGLTILAAFAIGWFLAGISLRPIHQITQTAQAIGAEQDFSRRVEHQGPNDEIGQLAVTFNGMLTELEASYRQVEQALQAQRRFVADASHELRTPLTTIRGNIELLRHEPPMEAREQADVLADARDETERLIRLVNQLLMLARADAGRPVRREPLAVKPLLEDVCRQAQLLAPQRTIECVADRATTALGDRDAFQQVLLILLDNALVHTPEGARISVTADTDQQRVIIRIRDTGPGIAPELLEHIFERFYRGDVSRSGGGMGLGLSIAKELVEAQGGTLEV
ncbi:MAG TPA: HAMP domain-containing sensor histidine kinase, partial [Anaerolineae bacterium]